MEGSSEVGREAARRLGGGDWRCHLKGRPGSQPLGRHPLAAGGRSAGSCAQQSGGLSAQCRGTDTPRGREGTGLAWTPSRAQGGRCRALCVRLRTHPPPQKHSQLHQQQLLYLLAQVRRDALGLDLALGDDLQGAG